MRASRKGWPAIHNERKCRSVVAVLRASHGRAGVRLDYGDATLTVGDEPNRDRKRRQAAPGSEGFEGDARRPLASPNVRILGRLAPDHYRSGASLLPVARVLLFRPAISVHRLDRLRRSPGSPRCASRAPFHTCAEVGASRSRLTTRGWRGGSRCGRQWSTRLVGSCVEVKIRVLCSR